MKERGYYTIKTASGEIGLRFSTWTFKRFSEIKGDISLTQLLNGMSEISIGDLVNLILCAAECYCKEKKVDFNYNDFDAAGWIDDMGGVGGKEFAEMNKALLSSFIDNSMEGENLREVDSPETKSANVA